MTISEKVAYIKGLAKGLDLGEDTKQDKLLTAIIDVLEDVALSMQELEDAQAELNEQVDAVDEDLAALEDDFYEEEPDACDCDDCHDEDVYEVECPKCHDLLYVDADMLEEGSIVCPNCKTELEFDFECDAQEEDHPEQAE